MRIDGDYRLLGLSGRLKEFLGRHDTLGREVQIIVAGTEQHEGKEKNEDRFVKTIFAVDYIIFHGRRFKD
jgi:hypothetical protein